MTTPVDVEAQATGQQDPTALFLGPWELFEIVEAEFRTIDPAFKVDLKHVWRFEPVDILDVPRAAKRMRDLRVLDSWPAQYPNKIAELASEGSPRVRQTAQWVISNTGMLTESIGQSPPAPSASLLEKPTAHELAEILNAMLLMPPAQLVDICWSHMLGERGRALRKNGPRLHRLHESMRASARDRFNRQVLELALTDLVSSAADRAFHKVLVEARTSNVHLGADGKPRIAVSLSGGGIRSASFSLGVLQGLAHANLLEHVHYLSTVSGGGYIGSWLSSWMTRIGRSAVIEELKKPYRNTLPLSPEPSAIRHLRGYSNYLSPRKGLLSADLWTLIATILRNLLLNWSVVLPGIAFLLMMPILASATLEHAPRAHLVGMIELLVFIGGVAATMGVYHVHTRRPLGEEEELAQCAAESPEADVAASLPRRRSERAFLVLCLLPICVAISALSIAWFWVERVASEAQRLQLPFGLATPDRMWLGPVLFATMVHFAGWAGAEIRLRQSPRDALGDVPAVLATGAMVGLLIFGVSRGIDATTAMISHAKWIGRSPLIWTGIANRYSLVFTILALPSYILALTLGSFAFVGITSERRRDEDREWSSRFTAWLLIAAVGWLAFSLVVLAGSFLLAKLTTLLATGAGALLTGSSAAALGKSEKTPDSHEKGIQAKGLAGAVRKHTLFVASTLALVLALMTIAALNVHIVRAIADAGISRPAVFPGPLGVFDLGTNAPPNDGSTPSDWRFTVLVIELSLLLALLSAVFSLRIDVNKFSLHAMYRERLIRAYLGATRIRGTRYPNPFTGFDPADNTDMRCLGGGQRRGERAPIHILNMALNLTAANKLEWQDRKARAFTVTQYHAGSWGLGYRSTRLVNGVPDTAYGGRHGISLGTAMAVSGAAASPSMGYNSSPAITFLMALFNARLGWWLGNPGWAGRKTFAQSTPKRIIPLIFTELLSLTGDSSDFVYLSDGGHFENLGLYELVLRRCPFIIVVDASCDHTCTLDDLGNAIRRIRIDFGIPIAFDTFDFKPRPADNSIPPRGEHVAIGRIDYGAAQEGATPGTIIYIKPELSATIPRDAVAYANASPSYPHESTTDQFFSEAQLESYRALGQYSADEAVKRMATLR